MKIKCGGPLLLRKSSFSSWNRVKHYMTRKISVANWIKCNLTLSSHLTTLIFWQLLQIRNRKRLRVRKGGHMEWEPYKVSYLCTGEWLHKICNEGQQNGTSSKLRRRATIEWVALDWQPQVLPSEFAFVGGKHGLPSSGTYRLGENWSRLCVELRKNLWGNTYMISKGTPYADESTDRLRECVSDKEGCQQIQDFCGHHSLTCKIPRCNQDR